MSERGELRKALSPMQVLSLALGCIIGFGCFVLPGDFLGKSGPLGTVIGILVGAGLMLLIIKSYGMVVEQFPVAGAEYAHAYFAAGRYHAFVCGWFLALGYLAIIPLNATALALLGKFVAPSLFARGYLYTVAGYDVFFGEILLASTAIVVVAWFNLRSVHSVGDFQKILTFVLVGTALFVGVGIFFFGGASPENLQPWFAPDKTTLGSILAIVAVAPWLFVGFDTLPQAAEELAFSESQTKRLMVISVVAGALLYVIVTLATAVVRPWPAMLADHPAWMTGAAVQSSLGTFGLAVLVVAIVAAIFTGINGFFLASSRLMFSMARARVLPAFFSRIRVDRGTPAGAVLFAAGLALVAPWFGRQALVWIVDMSALGTAFGYGYTCLAAYFLARQTSTRVYAILGTVASAGFVVLLTVPGMPGFMATPSWVALAGWVLLGGIFFATQADAYRAIENKELDGLILGPRGVANLESRERFTPANL